MCGYRFNSVVDEAVLLACKLFRPRRDGIPAINSMSKCVLEQGIYVDSAWPLVLRSALKIGFDTMSIPAARSMVKS